MLTLVLFGVLFALTLVAIFFWRQDIFVLKYYEEIRQAQARTPPRPPLSFDIKRLGIKRGSGGLPGSAALWWIARQFFPIIKIGRLVIVSRAEDVAQVLQDSNVFAVPFGLEMTELAGGANFILGMDGPEHDELKALIESTFLKSDLALLKKESSRVATALLAASYGRIDVMHDYFMRVATETCLRYFGLEPSDHDAYADWCLAISNLLFADPLGRSVNRDLALAGADRARAVFDRAIRKAQDRIASAIPSDTIVDRLVRLMPSDPRLSVPMIRATLMGLSVGCIPTATTAAGKIFEELRRDPVRWNRATACADSGDEIELVHMLREAARLNPTVPVQWRYAKAAGSIAKGTLREKRVRQNSVLMVAAQSALRDGRVFKAPNRFVPEREQKVSVRPGEGKVDFLFGAGPHGCLGEHVVLTLAAESFRALLSQKALRPVDSNAAIEWVGPFPRRFDMQFELVDGAFGQAMVTICAPVLDGVDEEKLRADVALLGNPALSTQPSENGIARVLAGTGIVHFASITVADLMAAGVKKPYIILELNIDGTQDAGISVIAAAAAQWLVPIFDCVAHEPGESLESILRRNALGLRCLPWGAIGLDFAGTGEFSVGNIDKQARLAAFARDALDEYLRKHASLNRPSLAIEFVRQMIRPSSEVRHAASAPTAEGRSLAALLERGAEFQNDLYRPSRQKLQLSTWVPPSRLEALAKALWAGSGNLRPWTAVVAGVMIAAIYIAFGRDLLEHVAGRVLVALAGTLNALIVLLAAVSAVILLLLRRNETQDRPDDKTPPLDGRAGMRAATHSENHRGYVQNHFTAVPPLQTGWFRRLLLAAALEGVRLRLKYFDRPGYVTTIGTIHYAQWFRPPGTDTLVFLSNYDGSWESYLEDFIAKAHWGQTAVWSNCTGFPSTQFLIWGGAQDGDRFKRWVRRQQVISQFWFSAYPHLSTDQIRNNALVADGLARITTDTAARAWLGCFGSLQRPEYAIESDEVQSLVFRAMGALPYGVYAPIAFPNGTDGAKRMGRWLTTLLPPRKKDDAAPSVTFGDYPVADDGPAPLSFGKRAKKPAVFVAFSAGGLAKLGLGSEDGDAGLSTFPAAFNLGMAQRSRILGDHNEAGPQHWRWWDVMPPDSQSKQPSTDAVLIILADSREGCDRALDAHIDLLGGDAILDRIPTQPTHNDIRRGDNWIAFEHFGFRDGISQPVIQGTQRLQTNPCSRDVVEPGEFILGYKNNQSTATQSYFPPTPVVRAASDFHDHLSTVAAQSPSDIPDFEIHDDGFRDFGRNGTYLAIRQLSQDVDGFHAFAEQQAHFVKDRYAQIGALAEQNITREWVEAKMVGRWHDGTPLIDKPHATSSMRGSNHSSSAPDNDFAYGADDPTGIACPLGAHIRRANPRDGLLPGDPTQQAITNRHRILRRGRAYEYRPAGSTADEKGLLFISLCTDLERQYEFVQQTWVGSPFFQGLVDESDPLVGLDRPDLPNTTSRRVFTIPTPSGPLMLRNMQSFVRVRAGGYFFLPSRSTLAYLASLSATAPH